MFTVWGGSPGLVVMGGDSCPEGCGFEYQHSILGGHFFTNICCKNCNFFLFEKTKINEKEAGDGPCKMSGKRSRFALTAREEKQMWYI